MTRHFEKYPEGPGDEVALRTTGPRVFWVFFKMAVACYFSWKRGAGSRQLVRMTQSWRKQRCECKHASVSVEIIFGIKLVSCLNIVEMSTHPVKLYVYELSRGLARQMSPLLLGKCLAI